MNRRSNEPEREVRTVVIEDIELRAADDGDDTPTIAGYGAVYGSPSVDLGGFREIVDPAAFTRSLKGRDEIRSFFNHDPSRPLGSSKAGNLTLKSDDRGLYYEIKPPKTTYASDVVEAVRAKLVRGSSFAFITKTDSWHEEKGVQVRTLMDVDLLEVGPVTMPAYERTTTQVRSMLEARGIVLDGDEQEDEPLDILDVLSRWKPRDEAEYRAVMQAVEAALLPPIEPPPEEAWMVEAAHRARSLELLRLSAR